MRRCRAITSAGFTRQSNTICRVRQMVCSKRSASSSQFCKGKRWILSSSSCRNCRDMQRCKHRENAAGSVLLKLHLKVTWRSTRVHSVLGANLPRQHSRFRSFPTNLTNGHESEKIREICGKCPFLRMYPINATLAKLSAVLLQ